MRIVPLLAGAPHGGAETFFVDLCAAFARAGLEVAPVIRPNAGREAALREAGLPVRTAPFGRWLDARTGAVLRGAVAEVRPHVVLAFMNRAAAWMPPGDHVKLARIGGYYNAKYHRRCDAVLCITSAIRDHMRAQGWPAERAHVVPNFVRAGAAPPADRAALDTPAGAPVLLVPGRLHANKGIDVAIRALADVPAAVLWIAGEGPERGALERLAEQLGVAGRVRFLGWRSDRAALFRACDAVVFSSRHEPFGTVSLEAWAYGRPLVTTDADGPAALVRHGTDALMVPRDDPAALAAAVRSVLADPALAAALAAEGRARHAAEYGEAAGVARYLEVFRHWLGHAAPRASEEMA